MKIGYASLIVIDYLNRFIWYDDIIYRERRFRL